MSDFDKITFKQPSYPIYKAFIIPYRLGDSVYDVIEVGSKEVDQWRNMLKRLKSFLLKAMEVLSSGGRKLEDHERLEILGDLITLFLRAPLNREVLPGLVPNPLKAYAFMKLTRLEDFFEEWKRLEFDPLEFTRMFYGSYSERLKKYPEGKLLNVLGELETAEIADILESCWFLIPADTRPILNNGSLLSHLLLTSAIAWSMAVNRGLSDRRDLARLRLAAMLHDIGKPFRYEDHVRASIEVAEELLRGILREDDIRIITDLIREHHYLHPRSDLGEIIKEADRFASAIDRLRMLLDRHFIDLKSQLEDLARELGYASLNEAFEDWKFWQRVHEKYDIKSLSERFVKRLRETTKNFTIALSEIDEAKENSRNIKVVLIDVGGIQSFIYRSHSLRQVAAASLVVDSLVMAYIVAYIQRIMSPKYWFPYESFLYTAGGNVELLVPEVLLKDIENKISELSDSLVKYGISLRIASAELYENYSRTLEELMAAMALNKVRIVHKQYQVDTSVMAKKGVRNICKFCFTEPPTKRVPTPEGEIEACEICYRLNEIGLNVHFKRKYESPFEIDGKIYSPADTFGIPWDGETRIKASEKIMELIAGHDRNELERSARMRNIAVIKVDGTLMGALMATSLSIADAYERSARIDLALKKALDTAIREIYSGVKRLDESEAARAALSIKMGMLYAGGDDAVIFVPSWSSPLIALVLGKEFLSNLGRVRGLSIGVAVASPKANVWALIDAASQLMKEAKEEARKGIEEGSAKSFICFDIVEAGDLSSSTVAERLASLRREKLTIQPLSIEDFERMLCGILTQGREASEGTYSYSDIARICYLASRNVDILGSGPKSKSTKEEVEKIQDGLKEIREAISKTIQAAKSMIAEVESTEQYLSYAFSIAYIYACRQFARLGKKSYEFVRSLIPDKLDLQSSLSDVDRLIKIIGGGMI